MSFIEDLRKAQRDESDALQRENDFNDRLDTVVNLYREYSDKTGQKYIGDDVARIKMRDFIYKNGLEDGELKEGDYDNQTFVDYGTALLDKLFEGGQSFDNYVAKNASKSVQRTYDSVKSRKENPGAWADKLTLGSTVLGAAAAGGPAMFYPAAGVFGAGAMIDKKNQGTLDEMYANYQKEQEGIYDNAFQLIENYDKYAEDAAKAKKENSQSDGDGESDAGESAGTSSDETEGEEITYTYKPGDTFGQVIMDLGLNTEKGLWGDDGDVAFYDKQLWAQGAPDPVTGNIPIGTTIKLRKRKV